MKNHKSEYHINHTKIRYLERFNEILSDDEYDELCSLLSIENSIRLTAHKYRNIIKFKEHYIWCTFNRYKYIITVYFLSKKEIISYNNGKIDYSKATLKYKEKNDRKKIFKKTQKHAISN